MFRFLVIYRFFAGILVLLAFATSSFAEQPLVDDGPGVAEQPLVIRSSLRLPWKKAGLNERQAAAHLLDRLAYGARPGEIDKVVKTGITRWVDGQLRGDLDDSKVDLKLENFHSLNLSVREAAKTYPPRTQVLRMAQRSGVVDEQQIEEMQARREEGARRGMGGDQENLRVLKEYVQKKGFRPQFELVGELMVQKLLRAVYSENQLQEVLTDFWFNHFNVSLTNNECRVFIAAYERDAIRPFVLGDFREMLEATAKHPAMLLYLDNARSVAPEGTKTTFDRSSAERFGRRGAQGKNRRGRQQGGKGNSEARRRPKGLNENYARELMELHTLGVDGGYTQDDVVAVARAFTGWATYPPESVRREFEQRIARAKRFPEAGFIFEESFIFRADAHDAEEKVVLGHRLLPGRGIADGEEVLDVLAFHAATALHLARKLAVRFVSDEPPAVLVDRLAVRFLVSQGDLLQVMRALLESPEFWSEEARTSKIKSPFELAVSSVRALGAKITHPRPLLRWIGRMGQPLYAYQAPTGYPDRAETWVNTGSLLNRMNFGIEFATGRISGLRFNLVALNQHREPESLKDALVTYVPLLLPERDPEETLRRLEPMVRDPSLGRKIVDASPEEGSSESYDAFDDWDMGIFPGGGQRERSRERTLAKWVDNSYLAQVVGVILGSPEFQRR
jgi:uncharacterized protein (DUF1800 family)